MCIIVQADENYRDPNLYNYEYHSEANIIKDNPTFMNPGYQPLPKPQVRKEVRMSSTYFSPNQIAVYFEKLNVYFLRTATITVYGNIAVYLNIAMSVYKPDYTYLQH